MNYYISDTHFGHKAILKLDRRPFSDPDQMENAIICNWNKSVCPGDTTYILGDFCWGKAEDWLKIVRKLNGSKVLIEGNHDLKNYPVQLKREFADIKDYKEIKDNGRHVIVSHYPIPFYKHSNNPNYYMLCGHVHVSAENDYLERIIAMLKSESEGKEGIHFRNCAQIYNVGAMMPWMDYTPRSLDEIIYRRRKWEESCRL